MDGTRTGTSSARAVRVLVVDDTDHVRRMLVDMLTLDGFDVVGTAAGGADAVRVAGDVSPDVVVMDLRMPGMDGLEATRRLVAALPALPVVVYTAYVDRGVEEAAREAGAALVLDKVEGLPELERELRRLTQGVPEA